jgi:hypothetical protein
MLEIGDWTAGSGVCGFCDVEARRERVSVDLWMISWNFGCRTIYVDIIEVDYEEMEIQ